MVLEPNTGRWASKDVEPRRGWWIVRSNIGWGGERTIIYKDVEIISNKCILKILRGSPENLKRTISASSVFGLLQTISTSLLQ